MARWQGNNLTPSNLKGPEFRTKRECRAWIVKTYGYIRTRKDLRCAPCFWRVPRAVQVTVTVTED